MKKLLVCILLLAALLPLAAQSNSGRGVVKGVVSEKPAGGGKEPVMQATVRLLNPKDSSLITGAVTGLNGDFEIKNIKWGSYLMQVSYIGYAPLFKSLQLSARQPRVEVGEVTLETTNINLSEVVITGSASEVVVKTDTVEYNPNAYTNKENDVVEDLLKQLPGVEVGDDGKITYGGKEITKILIDGKEFFGDDPLVASKNLPVDIIEKLQVIDEKSDAAKKTGVDDGEKEKVINISVKKEKKKGWFGDVSAGYGTKDRYSAKALVNRFLGNDKYTLIFNSNNVNNMGFGDRGGNMRGGNMGGIITSHSLGGNFINEFGKKVKAAGNVTVNASNADAQRISRRENLLQDSSYYTNTNNKRLADSKGIGFNYKIEYNPDTSNYFVFVPSFNYGRNIVNSENISETLDGKRDTVNSGIARNESVGNSYSGSLRVEYIHRFKKQGRSIGINATGALAMSDGDGFNNTINRFYKENDSISHLQQHAISSGDDKSVRASVSYTEPLFGKKNYLQFRYFVRYSRNVSEKNTYNFNEETQQYTDFDTLYSRGNANNFLSHRFSLTYRVVREKYRYAIGARVEPSSTHSKSYVKETILADLPTRNVVNFSPNAMYRYNFSNTHYISSEYEGWMQQPSATQLLPVKDVSNPLHITEGNPLLLPSYQHNMNVEYNNSMPEKQITISTELGANFIQNSIVSKSVLDKKTGVTNTTYENVDGVWSAFGRAMISLPFKNKRFQLSSFTFARYGDNVGFVNGQRNVASSLSLSEMLRLRFRMDRIFETGVRLNGRYGQTVNSVQKQSDRTTFDYTASYFLTAFLPLDFTVGSDLRYNGNSGYSAGFEKKEWIWNADISKSFLKGKSAIISLRAYDILGQMKNISRSVTGTYIEDAEFNALTSYAVLSFTYKFNTFGGKGNPQASGDGERRRHGGGRHY